MSEENIPAGKRKTCDSSSAVFWRPNPTSSLKDDMASAGPDKPRAVPKRQAIVDIRAAHEILQELGGEEIKKVASSVLVELKALTGDLHVTGGVSLENF